jgi:hypothetical protein
MSSFVPLVYFATVQQIFLLEIKCSHAGSRDGTVDVKVEKLMQKLEMFAALSSIDYTCNFYES